MIEMGAISEDVIPESRIPERPEDSCISNNPNGMLQEGEDIGLDMLTNAQEVGRYGGYPASIPGTRAVTTMLSTMSTVGHGRARISRSINGTENNQNGPAGLIPDTEDLNSNGVVDRRTPISAMRSRWTRIPSCPEPLHRRVEGTWAGTSSGFRSGTSSSKVGSPIFGKRRIRPVALPECATTLWPSALRTCSLVGNQWQELRKDSTLLRQRDQHRR